MASTNLSHYCLWAASLLALFAMSAESTAAEPTQVAREVIAATGVRGGLVVHLGCGDGSLTTALRSNERYLVHGLDADEQAVQQARRSIAAAELLGKVTVEQFAGDRLPYADNIVNLLVVEDAGAVTEQELQRVLVPRGAAYLREDDGWRKIVKPRPKNIDEWTHFLHGPDNNAVAKDTAVAEPHHLQWVGGPKWARGHEVLATISAVVTAGGRMFVIADEGPTASVELPSEWTLSARDAFNGLPLWRRKIENWESRYRPFRSGPPQLPRRLVAIGDTVYVTPGYLAPLHAIDAATGETRHVYSGTRGCEEIIYDRGTLFLVIGDPKQQDAAEKAARRGQSPPPIDKQIVALNAADGAELWRCSDEQTAALFAQTMAVSQGRLFYQNTRRVFCLHAETGELLWQTDRPAATKRPAWSVPTLVVHNGVLISADRQAPKESPAQEQPPRVQWTVSFAGGNAPPGEMIALSVDDGKELWRAPCKEGYNSPVDVLVSDGLIWSGNLVKAGEPGITQARDPKTGRVKRERPRDQNYFTPGMSHHRCYRNRATERFVLLGRSGVELLDLKTGAASANHWVRGACQYGVLPANGLIYVPPHTCACYLKTKLNGFNALAPLRPGERAESVDATITTPQLQQGPAFGQTAGGTGAGPEDWPTYRCNAARSGSTSMALPEKLAPAWSADLGGELTAMTSAGDALFVARQDAHRLYCLDTTTGEEVWRFTAGGRIDSPPSIADGLVLFGSHDGHVYCLRAKDGELVWRFRAGPEDRRIVVEGRLESTWPVHGSVLVQDGTAYFAAGRSSFVDGGIFLHGVKIETGEVGAQSRFSGRDPETGRQPKNAVKGFDMAGGLPDVLSMQGDRLYMRDRCFDRRCIPTGDPQRHLFSPTGFLDDSWWHRSYWLLGDSFTSGWGGWSRAGAKFASGRILVFDDDAIYGFGRDRIPSGNAGQWRTGEKYRLFAASLAPRQLPAAPAVDRKGKKKRQPVRSTVDFRWSQQIEPEGRALLLAGRTLYVAGPHGPAHRELEAFRGAQGVSLAAYSTADGRRLSAHPLEGLPVFDGLAAARGRLFLSTKDGKVLCWK